MATRAKALKKFAKNVLHHDLVGMSETAVLKDLLKQEFNIDAVGNSVVSVLMNAVSNDGGGEAVNPLVLTLITPTDTCYISEGSQVGFAADVEVGGEPVRIWQYGNGTLEFGFVESITLFGIPLESYPDFDESLVSMTAEIVLENGVATMTATFTYGEYTDTAVLTANHECVMSDG